MAILLRRFVRTLKDFRYFQIKSRIFPSHRQIRKAIPRWWIDTDNLIEDVVFQALIEFWEPQGENGEEHLRYQCTLSVDEYAGNSTISDIRKENAKRKRAYFALKIAYEWAKVRQQKHESAKSFEAMEPYRKLDTKHLSAIIRYRGMLWT